MTQYKKRPPTVAAIQWTGDNLEELLEFIPQPFSIRAHSKQLLIPSTVGSLTANKGDWVVNNDGDYEVYFPSSFEEMYEAV